MADRVEDLIRGKVLSEPGIKEVRIESNGIGRVSVHVSTIGWPYIDEKLRDDLQVSLNEYFVTLDISVILDNPGGLTEGNFGLRSK